MFVMNMFGMECHMIQQEYTNVFAAANGCDSIVTLDNIRYSWVNTILTFVMNIFGMGGAWFKWYIWIFWY